MSYQNSPYRFQEKGKFTEELILDENKNPVFCMDKAMEIIGKRDKPYMIFNDWCKYISGGYYVFSD